MIRLPSYFMGKSLISGVLAAGILTTPFSLYANVSQQPLSLTEGVPPNILVTLDDSGSMARAYAPDNISGSSSRRAARSHTYNPLYYNPDATYVIPKKVSLVNGSVVVEDYPTPIFTNAYNDGFAQSGTRVNLSKDYRLSWSTATSFIQSCPTGLSCSNGRTRAHYYQYNQGPNCPAAPNISSNNNCYTHVSLPADQEENFAIWYSFYRTRFLATRSAINLAFYGLPNDVRVTWGALNTCNIGTGSSSGNCNNNTMARFSGQHRVNFFSWLRTLPYSGGTPLHRAMKRAGDFLSGNNLAYGGDGNGLACRSSYHILMSDGYWNNQPAGSTNHDGSLPAPYKDSHANTLADWAYHYWSTDLRPSMANDVKPYIPFKSTNATTQYNDPRNNPATWQHMVNYTVGLGLSNALTNSSYPTWGGSTFANFNELMYMGSNGKSWPAVSNDNANNVYDMWHAAINSRGEFFSADSPEALVLAFSTILGRIADRTTSASSPAISSGFVADDTSVESLSYQTSYSSSDNWAGDLKAFRKYETWNSATNTWDLNVSEEWSARTELDAMTYTARNINIATATTTAGASNLREFTWANAGNSSTPGTLAYWLRQNPDNNDILEGNSSNAQHRLQFLRGDRSRESSTFRQRRTVLGDMVSSKPVAVRGARLLTNYANRIEGNDAYTTFFETHKERQPVVYVGANDGMLHGFDADTGQEIFAFIPTAVFPKLHKLTGKSYEGVNHQFYVDGSPVVSDAYINNEWRTVLIGTLRAGGKGLFALDITNPEDIRLLWEFDDSKIPQSNEVRLGYTFAQPTVARLHNGRWAVVTGNGYESANHTNGKAALLIIDLETGALTKSIEVAGTNGVANGLSTPRLADMNVDGVADYAYAGDLQGNMWRFNLAPRHSDATPFARQATESQAASNSFVVSFNGSPLYRSGKPITAPPTIIRHPTQYGYLVLFGTGKYYQDGDKNGVAGTSQAIYGIWDTQALANTASARHPATLTRAELQQQTLTKNADGKMVLTSNDVVWAQPPTSPTGTWQPGKYGWYLDLSMSKEMMIESMQSLGQTVFFQTLIPNSDPCASGAENWSYAVNPHTGGRTLHHAFVNERTTPDAGNSEGVVSGIRQDGEGGLTIGQRPGGEFELCTGLSCEEIAPDPASIGRQTWRNAAE